VRLQEEDVPPHRSVKARKREGEEERKVDTKQTRKTGTESARRMKEEKRSASQNRSTQEAGTQGGGNDGDGGGNDGDGGEQGAGEEGGAAEREMETGRDEGGVAVGGQLERPKAAQRGRRRRHSIWDEHQPQTRGSDGPN